MCCLSPLKDHSERGEEQKPHLADTLLDILGVLVEFWCQQHNKLNPHLVDKGLKDLAEHFAVMSQGMENRKSVGLRDYLEEYLSSAQFFCDHVGGGSQMSLFLILCAHNKII